MTSKTCRTPKHPKRSKTKELLAVAGLTAAEYSSSYAVQAYLGKTIQNASHHPSISPDTSKGASKLQKPLNGLQTGLRTSSPGDAELEKQRCRVHRHTQVFQQVSSEEHFDLSRLSLADEPFRRQPRPTPAVIAQGAEEEKHQYAIFTRMQKIDGQQAVRKIDKTKLGRQHEALGSHPPLTLEEEVESDEAGSTTQISSRSTRTYSE